MAKLKYLLILIFSLLSPAVYAQYGPAVVGSNPGAFPLTAGVATPTPQPFVQNPAGVLEVDASGNWPQATRTPTSTPTPQTPTSTYTPTNTFTNTPTFTNTSTFTATSTFTPVNTLPPGTNTNTPTNTYTSTPTRTNTFSPTPTSTYTITNTYTFTPTATNTATFTNTPTTPQLSYYSADVLSPVTVTYGANVKTLDVITSYSVPPTGSVAVTNMIYNEMPGQAVTTNSAVTQIIAHPLLSGEVVASSIAARSFLIQPRITPTQTAIATYAIGIDRTY